MTKSTEPMLFCLNIFFRNDTPQGFGIGLTPEFFEDNPGLREQVINISQMTINHFKTLPEQERQEFIAETWVQLEECRLYFVNNKNKNLVEGSEATDLSDESFRTLSVALDDISFLESIGLLKSDEFNGIQWIWLINGQISTTNTTYH